MGRDWRTSASWPRSCAESLNSAMLWEQFFVWWGADDDDADDATDE